MLKLIGFALLMTGTSLQCMAGAVVAVPEIDPATGAAAVALVGGGLVVLRARRKS